MLIFLLIFIILICIGFYINYKIKQNNAIQIAKKYLTQIQYIEDEENNKKLKNILKEGNILYTKIGNKPGMYKTKKEIIAVLNNGEKIKINLYTGDWSISIDKIDGWHFRIECWLEDVVL